MGATDTLQQMASRLPIHSQGDFHTRSQVERVERVKGGCRFGPHGSIFYLRVQRAFWIGNTMGA